MNDEVSVTEVMELEGWPEAPSRASARFRIVAVMLAVVLGCGLAALLIHIGSAEQQADNPTPSLFDVPHGPSGGLAGGGVPASPEETTEVTGTSTSITVTNQAPPADAGETAHRPEPSTVTESPTQSTTRTTRSTAPSGPGDSGGDPGNGGGPPPPADPTTTTPPKCVINLLGICV